MWHHSRMRTAILLLLLALTACSNTLGFRKSGATEADLKRDSYACQRDARFSYYRPPPTEGTGAAVGVATGLSGVKHSTDMNLFVACMEAGGWELVED